jgi:2-polyprenyl-6-methoxyphenol hydroxylase-like FAD-dependent oxidoreductase
MANDTYRTGNDADIVGAGMAGLLCALECRRNGIKVTIVEREEAINPKGENGFELFIRISTRQ